MTPIELEAVTIYHTVSQRLGLAIKGKYKKPTQNGELVHNDEGDGKRHPLALELYLTKTMSMMPW
jgi:hypothetical protein